MSTQNIIIAIVILIIGILIIKTVSKIFLKILTVVLLLGALAYVLLFFQGGLLGIGNKDFILYELRDKYCIGDERDQTKCDCIIEPLIEKIEEKYTETEIRQLQSDKAKSLQELVSLANDNKEMIKNCLKENNSEALWNEFLKDARDLLLPKKQ